MGAATKKKAVVGDLKFKFYRVVRLGNVAWKVYFKDANGQRWKATVAARRFFVVTEPNPTGVRVTIQPLSLKFHPKFRKDWRKVDLPTEKGEVRLLVGLTFIEMGV
jgi:hypothetical protein